MKYATLTTTQGSTWSTSINGTDEEIIAYFLGQWFNLGTVGDRMEQVCQVTIEQAQP